MSNIKLSYYTKALFLFTVSGLISALALQAFKYALGDKIFTLSVDIYSQIILLSALIRFGIDQAILVGGWSKNKQTSEIANQKSDLLYTHIISTLPILISASFFLGLAIPIFSIFSHNSFNLFVENLSYSLFKSLTASLWAIYFCNLSYERIKGLLPRRISVHILSLFIVPMSMTTLLILLFPGLTQLFGVQKIVLLSLCLTALIFTNKNLLLNCISNVPSSLIALAIMLRKQSPLLNTDMYILKSRGFSEVLKCFPNSIIQFLSQLSSNYWKEMIIFFVALKSISSSQSSDFILALSYASIIASPLAAFLYVHSHSLSSFGLAIFSSKDLMNHSKISKVPSNLVGNLQLSQVFGFLIFLSFIGIYIFTQTVGILLFNDLRLNITIFLVLSIGFMVNLLTGPCFAVLNSYGKSTLSLALSLFPLFATAVFALVAPSSVDYVLHISFLLSASICLSNLIGYSILRSI